MKSIYPQISDIFWLISRASINISSRKMTAQIRKNYLNQSSAIKKVAFDTRRVDQETTYIARRGLQNYHRSENFVSDAMFIKITAFDKLNDVLVDLKKEFGKEPEWQDSYTRVLASTVEKSLRKEQLDGDFSDAQPSMTSLAYLEELLFVRYRLTPNDLSTMATDQLRKSILQKDELLLRKDGQIKPTLPAEITVADVSKFSYEQMMEKMLMILAQILQNQNQNTNTNFATQSNNQVKEIVKSEQIKEIVKSEDKTITITIKN